MAENLNQNLLNILNSPTNETGKNFTVFSSMNLGEKSGTKYENRVQFYKQFIESHPEALANDAKLLETMQKYFAESYSDFLSLGGQSANNVRRVWPGNAITGLKNYIQENKIQTGLINEAFPTYRSTTLLQQTVQQTVQQSASPLEQSQTEAPASAKNVPTPTPSQESGPAQNPNKIPTLEPGVAKVPTLPTPIDAGLSSPQPVIEAEYNSGTYKRPESIFNSWVLAWEPTQKVGIVKVPIRTIREALSPQTYSNRLAYYNNLLNFSTEELIDFSQVYETIFLPMSSNKLILLQEFTLNRRNIQQTEITHGSRYFQVFTESFPDFTLEIQVVKFADVHKKVKLFFDNVMKRISETARYGGSLYLYDVLAEDIPAFDLNRLALLVTTNKLIKYRLLPRQIRMVASADDPHIMKISIDGTVVEWETQDDTLLPVNNKKAGLQNVTQELKPTNYIAAADKNQYIDPANRASGWKDVEYFSTPKNENEYREFFEALDMNLQNNEDYTINYGDIFANVTLESQLYLTGNTKTEFLGSFFNTFDKKYSNPAAGTFWNNSYINYYLGTIPKEGTNYVLQTNTDGGKIYLSERAVKEIQKTTSTIYKAMADKLINTDISWLDLEIKAGKELRLSPNPVNYEESDVRGLNESKQNYEAFIRGFENYIAYEWFYFSEKDREKLLAKGIRIEE